MNTVVKPEVEIEMIKQNAGCHRMTLQSIGRAFLLSVIFLSASFSRADTPIVTPKLPEFSLPDAQGKLWTQADFADRSLLIVAFLGTECPLAKLYAGTLETIRRDYEDRGIRVLGVLSNPQDSLAEMDAFRRRTGAKFEMIKDLEQRLAQSLGATRTPEVFVLDATGRCVYQGRIDDQYGIGTVLDSPRSRDLVRAIDESLQNKPISVPRTDAVGCLLAKPREVVTTQSTPTFHGQVSAILNRRCVECHRPGEIGPFALDNFEDASGWADMMLETIDAGRMPPWHASPDSSVEFSNDRTMPKQEIELIRRWVDAGAPEGIAADASAKPTVAPEKTSVAKTDVVDDDGRIWQLPRKPDHVFAITPEPFQVAARGEVQYQYFKVDPKFDRDVWVSAMQLRPGNRAVVHHILVFATPPGDHRSIQAARSYLDGYVPGVRAIPFGDGYAKKIPAGSELIFQVHYTPTGTPQTDQSEFGIVEVDASEVTHEVFTDSIVEPRLNIPPRDSNFEVSAKRRALPKGAELLALMPHMHVRGKSFRMELEQSTGWGFGRNRSLLLEIPRYDFNWQTAYVLSDPIELPQGGWMHGTAWYDNSEKNLSNPDPSATVRWGDQTWEEMMIGYFHYAMERKSL